MGILMQLWAALLVTNVSTIPLLLNVEGTLYPSISLLKIGREIMPTQGWDGKIMPIYRFKDLTTIEE
jgi:hypothetical protein